MIDFTADCSVIHSSRWWTLVCMTTWCHWCHNVARVSMALWSMFTQWRLKFTLSSCARCTRCHWRLRWRTRLSTRSITRYLEVSNGGTLSWLLLVAFFLLFYIKHYSNIPYEYISLDWIHSAYKFSILLFLTRDAMLSAVYAVVVCLCVCVCVCLCVCLSVTLRYCIKTAKRSITQITPHDSPGILVFWHQSSRRNSNGITPYGSDKCRWGGLKFVTFDEKRAITRKRYKIEA